MVSRFNVFRVPAPERTLLWLSVALLIKGALLWMTVHDRVQFSGTSVWGSFSGDSSTYFAPIESLIAGKGYTPDDRMPGYGLPYLLLRSFVAQPVALDLLVIAQWIMDAFTVFFVARLALLITGSTSIFLAAFALMNVCYAVTAFDGIYLTETFATGALVLATHQFTLFLISKDPKRLLFSGGWLTWLIFLRPVFAPVLLLAVALVIHGSTSWRTWSRACIFLLLPFAVIDGAWITRNITVHHRPIVLTKGMFVEDTLRTPYYPLIEMMRASGGSCVWGDATAEIGWFNVQPWSRLPGAAPHGGITLPAFMCTSTFGPDSLNAIAIAVNAWYDSDDTARKTVLHAYIDDRSKAYVTSYRTEKPWNYRVAAPLRLLSRSVLTDATDHMLPSPRNMIGKVLKHVNTVLFVLSVPLALLFCAVILLRRNIWPRNAWMIPACFLFIVLVHPLLLRFCEQRYFVTVLPFGLLISIIVIHRLYTGTRTGVPVVPRS